jgi:phosphinothricin acetyltransferase
VTPTARDQPDTLVRPARVDDVPGVVAVAATRGALPDGFAARARAWVADPGRWVVVGDRSGVVVGWAMLARWSGYDDVPDGLYVSALTVDPAWWRCGIGTRLLADLLVWADPADGPVRSVVNARNAPSLALHAAHGFREVRRAPTFARIGFDGGTGVLLRRDGRKDQA